MKPVTLWKKEMKVAFASPIAYVSLTVFLMIIGYMFFALARYAALHTFSLSETDKSIVETVFRPLYRNVGVVLLFIIPALTMRLFAEEKRSRTLELLFTYPLGDFDLLVGKFLAALSLLGFMLIPTLVYPIFIRNFTFVEWPVIASQYLGLFLLGAGSLAVGLWASSLTDNQIVAATITLGALLGFWTIGWISQNPSETAWSKIFSQLSIVNHFDSFAKGVLNSADIAYYLLFTLFFLYAALKTLEARAWWGAGE